MTVLVFAAINTLWYIFLAKVDYASDQEWSKYMTFMGIITVAQAIDVIATLYFTVKQYRDAISQGCYEENKGIFVGIFIIICFNGVLVFIMTVSIITLSLQLFGLNPQKHFFYKEEPDIKIRM